ncbi:amino acid adenylation domain-containing protein [Nonomuraea sp. NPDC050451]|uniref:amino acid adenylation domain-containing protein n=1 Tax=Nonomuraea sp. NPDC050451 TaxID=3364364 RepID=UPI003792AFA2
MSGSQGKTFDRVNSLVASRARARPGAPAIVAPDAELSYGELLERAHGLADRLRGLGVDRGSPVGLCVPQSAALAVGALAVLELGGVYVAMDPDYPEERLRFMLADSGARALITHDGVVPARDDAHHSPVPLDEDLAYIVYTSGSSGRPKGVLVEHRGLRALVDWHHRAFGITAADRALHLAGPGFDAAVWETWANLGAGASIHIPPREIRAHPVALRDWIVERGVTIGFLPTALAEALMVLPWPRDTALRTVLTGGDVLHRRPPADLPFTLVNNYGLTEATVVSTSGPVRPDQDGRPSIGRPIDVAEIHVVDDRLRPSLEGEILIGGPLVARGYLGDPDLTRERFVPDHLSGRPGGRLLRTGDLAHRRPDGELEFLGRADMQVNMNGIRIEPDEIAATITRHPHVRSSVVVARTTLVAYVVAVADAPADLEPFLAAQLPEPMLPSAYVWLEELPMTANGKVDVGALPDPPEHAGPEPHTETETALAPLVAAILTIERVGVTENFFRLGGHSLLGAQLLMQVGDRFGVNIPLRFLFDHPTVRELAQEIDRLLLDELEALSDQDAARLAAEIQEEAG